MSTGATSKWKRCCEAVHAFVTERSMDHAEECRPSRLHRFAHFWLLVVKSFVRNRCPVRASALAYTTLLALIPLLDVGISVSASFLQKEGEKPVRELIDKLVANVAPALNLSVNT